jgi:predicted transposase YbfD/YdcC
MLCCRSFRGLASRLGILTASRAAWDDTRHQILDTMPGPSSRLVAEVVAVSEAGRLAALKRAGLVHPSAEAVTAPLSMTGRGVGGPAHRTRAGKLRAIAVDGKTLRGSGHGGEYSRHLPAALGHAHGIVLGQVGVGAKTNEIPLFTALLDRIQITGAVITADALHAQQEHATCLAGRGAHYLLIVKRNQPSLYAQLAALPWRDVPKAYDKRERGHGRTGRRTLKVTAVARGLALRALRPAASAAIAAQRIPLPDDLARQEKPAFGGRGAGKAAPPARERVPVS